MGERCLSIYRENNYASTDNGDARKYFQSGTQVLISISYSHLSSVFFQVLISNLLDQWGLAGFQSHIKRVQDFYKSQRDAMLRSLDKHMTGSIDAMTYWPRKRFLRWVFRTSSLLRNFLRGTEIRQEANLKVIQQTQLRSLVGRNLFAKVMA